MRLGKYRKNPAYDSLKYRINQTAFLTIIRTTNAERILLSTNYYFIRNLFACISLHEQ